MAQRATMAAPPIVIERRAWSRRVQDRLATHALTTPALANSSSRSRLRAYQPISASQNAP